MNIYLHIGLEKTGTTSIQACLYDNFSLEAGHTNTNIRYLSLLDKKNAMPLIFLAAESPPRYLLSQYISRYGSMALVQKKVREDLDGFRGWQGDLIISSEHLQSKLTSNRDIECLFNELERIVKPSRIMIVLYLRNQYDLLLSIESEAIKAGKISASVPKRPWTIPYYDNLFSHYNTITKWEAFVGKSNMIVKSFDLESNRDTLIESFLSVLQLSRSNLYSQLARKRNESMSSLALTIRSLINERLISVHGISKNEMARFQFINSILIDHFGVGQRGASLDQAAADALRDYYRDQNVKTEEYVGHNVYLWPESRNRSSAHNTPGEDCPISCDQLAILVADIAAEYDKKTGLMTGK